MRIAGNILSKGSFLLGLGGIALGVVYYSAHSTTTGVALIVGSLIGWLLLFGIGSALLGLDDLVNDTRRSADALEALAHRQRPPSRP